MDRRCYTASCASNYRGNHTCIACDSECLVCDDRTGGGTAGAESVLPDSGKRTEIGTGAVREPATGKGRFDLISPYMLQRLAQHYENGAAKYAVRNWEKGIPASRCFDSAVRHMNSYLMGDTSEDHLSAAIWNIGCIVDFEERLPQMIDIPTRPEMLKQEILENCKEEL